MITRAVAVCDHPPVLSAVEIDGADPAIWRLEKRESARPTDPLSVSFGVTEVRLRRIARQQVSNERRGDRWNVEPSGLWVECRPLPVRTAHRTWQLDRSFFVLSA